LGEGKRGHRSNPTFRIAVLLSLSVTAPIIDNGAAKSLDYSVEDIFYPAEITGERGGKEARWNRPTNWSIPC
jgi:hypothetical protein